MNDTSSRPDFSEIPEAAVAPKRRWSVQLVWIIPIIAAIIGGTLAVKALLERGRTITITFESGVGLEAGKTKIKYKDVEIGMVENIAIAEDRSHVVVTARMARESKSFLVEDTRFWVVRPRIYGGYVSGLGTLMGGTYIGVDIGKSGKSSRTFKGLEEQPVVTSDVRGTTFFLHAADLGSLNITSPIYFRRLQVGQVAAYDLDRDGRGVTFTIFVKSPYDRFVRTNSLFWHASGIDLRLNANGLKVNTESIVSILLGGIAFEVPGAESDAARAAPKSTFTLFTDKEEALKHAEAAQMFRLVFRESVRGLSIDSPVELNGVSLGEVTKINLEFDPRMKEFYVAADIRLYPERLRGAGGAGRNRPEDAQTFINGLIGRGLRARLGSGNLLTGQRYIALEFIRKAPKATINWSGQPPEFPTTMAGREDLQESLARVARKIEKMPLEEIAADVRQAVRSLDQSLRSADRLIRNVDADILPEARIVLNDAHNTLGEAREVLSKDSPMQNDLRETLRELSRAAWSVRILTDYLELHPESLIRGKKGEGK